MAVPCTLKSRSLTPDEGEAADAERAAPAESLFPGYCAECKPNTLTAYCASSKIQTGTCFLLRDTVLITQDDIPGNCPGLSPQSPSLPSFPSLSGHHSGLFVLVPGSMWTAPDLELNFPRLDRWGTPGTTDTLPLVSSLSAVAGNISQHFHRMRPSLP